MWWCCWIEFPKPRRKKFHPAGFSPIRTQILMSALARCSLLHFVLQSCRTETLPEAQQHLWQLLELLAQDTACFDQVSWHWNQKGLQNITEYCYILTVGPEAAESRCQPGGWTASGGWVAGRWASFTRRSWGHFTGPEVQEGQTELYIECKA